MNNEKKNNSSLPFTIIGLVLLAALVGGWWFYQNSKSQPVKSATANKSTEANNQNIFANAKPGASPAWSKGAPNAAVTIEEFADFQCPTCATMHPKVQEIRAAYGDRVRIIFRQYPLEQHPKAYDAAVAAEAAGLQGRFWEMQNLLFSNQQSWSMATDHRKLFEEYAQRIGLDVAKFNSDLAGTITKKRVDDDLQRGRSVKVASTPSFYINGRLAGDLNVDRMRQVIDVELQKAQSQTQINQTNPANK